MSKQPGIFHKTQRQSQNKTHLLKLSELGGVFQAGTRLLSAFIRMGHAYKSVLSQIVSCELPGVVSLRVLSSLTLESLSFDSTC